MFTRGLLHLIDAAFAAVAEFGPAGNDVIDAGRECRLGSDEKAQLSGFLDGSHAAQKLGGIAAQLCPFCPFGCLLFYAKFVTV